MSTFEIGEHDFLLDGRPHRVLSGALHYFRVHPEQWADRIEKARQLGLNTIETYVAWNAHEPERGRWHDEGMLDLGRFLDLVHEAGMHAIVRPGPYICAEWSGGGLPPWLFATDGVGVRSSEPAYLEAVSDFLRRVYEVVVPRQVDRGGPVVLVQVENEYGAYGDDAAYLQALTDLTRECGVVVPLVTVDQPQDDMLANGSIPGLHKTGSFGSRVAERLDTLRRHQPTGPLMCMEFWDGWFDHWGGHHHTTPVEQAAQDLDTLLAAGASVNLYMFHGGTNFAMTNGANDHGTHLPLVTSYDYDAPLDEAGRPTAKYDAFREVIARYAAVPELDLPDAKPAATVTTTLVDPVALLPDPQGWTGRTWSRHEQAPDLDRLGPDVPLALLRTELRGGPGPALLALGEVRDRVEVFLDDRPVGVLARDHHDEALVLPTGRGTLTLLVEVQGRVNYGARIGEPVGVVSPVTLDGEVLTGWQALPLGAPVVPDPWDRVPVLLAGEVRAGPTALRARFETEGPGDLFLDTSGWGRGVAWVNGWCLGRYWRRGPQQTLYVPAPVLRPGRNELVVLELGAATSRTVSFVPEPRLGHTHA